MIELTAFELLVIIVLSACAGAGLLALFLYDALGGGGDHPRVP